MSPEIVTTIAVVLGLLFSLAATLGAYAVFRVSKQSATVAEYKAMADRAKENADIWEDRSKATEARLGDTKKDLEEANRQITSLRTQVANLEGVITARDDIRELIKVITALAATLKDDHTEVINGQARILEHLGEK